MAPFIDWPENARPGVEKPVIEPGMVTVTNTSSKPEVVLSGKSFRRDSDVELGGIFERLHHRVRLLLNLAWFKPVLTVAEPHRSRRANYGRHDLRRPLLDQPEQNDLATAEGEVESLLESSDRVRSQFGADSGFVGVDVNGPHRNSRHEDSLTGYGAHCACAPTATTEAATSVVGDIVRDGTDKAPAGNSAVEESGATGAAAPSRRPHPTPSTESGSDQR